MTRALVLLATTAFVALLAFLTVSVATEGVGRPLVVLAFVFLAVLVLGALGALTSSDDD